ncbi:hypothetical protein EYZ11_001091 [Aspergillus tanneri]|uniref:Uncharacterized protein n=1 Tax=Aspergillus tanneri TaxID=1220188 RepID=A0A4S3JVN3_9EURO|nr:hypothetical protein EYZ11_001091 [Aspergillus tanneri]
MKKLGVYCGVLFGANIAGEVVAERFCQTTIGYDPTPLDLKDPNGTSSRDNHHLEPMPHDYPRVD